MRRQEEIQRLKGALEDRTKVLMGAIAGVSSSMNSIWKAGADLTDLASDGSHSEINSQLAQTETAELKLVIRALEKIDNGSYGTCEQCGRAIPVERLRALPHAPRCVACQRKHEKNQALIADTVTDAAMIEE